MPLTDIQIRNLRAGTKPRRIADGKGLYLLIRPNGKKFWRYRYRIDDKENTFALGEYPAMSLAEARAERERCRELIKQGRHPSHVRRIDRLRRTQEAASTFDAVAREWIEKNQPNWSAEYLRQVNNGLTNHVYPRVGALPIADLAHEPAVFLAILQRVAKGAPTMALLLRQWGSAIFRYAVATLRANADPFAALQGAIVRPKVRSYAHLTREEIPEFRAALLAHGGYPPTRISLELLLYLFPRPGELRAAEWREFDLKAAEWRVPAARMKMREPHIVPLPHQALALIEELQELTGWNRYLFPNNRRPTACMTGTTMNRALERMGYAGRFSSHGFRATASTLLNELGFHADWIERQLAHAPRNKVRGIYNRAQYLPERHKMMQAWADFVDGLSIGETVIPINRIG